MIGKGNVVEELNKFCKDNNLTAYKLAKYTNISITYAYNILGGKMENPSAWIIDRINQGIKTKMEDYIKFIDDFETLTSKHIKLINNYEDELYQV